MKFEDLINEKYDTECYFNPLTQYYELKLHSIHDYHEIHYPQLDKKQLKTLRDNAKRIFISLELILEKSK